MVGMVVSKTGATVRAQGVFSEAFSPSDHGTFIGHRLWFRSYEIQGIYTGLSTHNLVQHTLT